MTETASERIRVEAGAERCWAVATDFESYPEWVRDIREARVVARDADGRGTRVEFRAAALGKSIRYVLAYDYSEAPTGFSWRLDTGDELLRRLDGSYRFEPQGAGTRVHYDLAVDLTAPLPGAVKRRAAGLIMGSALKELKQRVEAAA